MTEQMKNGKFKERFSDCRANASWHPGEFQKKTLHLSVPGLISPSVCGTSSIISSVIKILNVYSPCLFLLTLFLLTCRFLLTLFWPSETATKNISGDSEFFDGNKKFSCFIHFSKIRKIIAFLTLNLGFFGTNHRLLMNAGPL